MNKVSYTVVVSDDKGINKVFNFYDNFGLAKKKYHELEKEYKDVCVAISLYEKGTLLMRTSKGENKNG